jgi:hypothetical protein
MASVVCWTTLRRRSDPRVRSCTALNGWSLTNALSGNRRLRAEGRRRPWHRKPLSRQAVPNIGKRVGPSPATRRLLLGWRATCPLILIVTTHQEALNVYIEHPVVAPPARASCAHCLESQICRIGNHRCRRVTLAPRSAPGSGGQWSMALALGGLR